MNCKNDLMLCCIQHQGLPLKFVLPEYPKPIVFIILTKFLAHTSVLAHDLSNTELHLYHVSANA